jgi:peptidyl-prolyl cis-trans isomerase D
MLRAMRKHAKYFYVLFFIVILTFIFWGVGTVDKPTSVSVAEIGKEKITVEEYWRAYERARQAYRELYKDKFDEEMEKKLQLKESILNSLIDERVLMISAGELRLTASDKELHDVIINDPRFMRDGVFRKDVYFRTLELNRLTPEMFENSMRLQLTELKIKRLVWSSVDINQLDLKDVSGDDKKAAEIKQLILFDKRNAVLKSYIDSIKQRMNLKINKDVIS